MGQLFAYIKKLPEELDSLNEKINEEDECWSTNLNTGKTVFKYAVPPPLSSARGLATKKKKEMKSATEQPEKTPV